MKISLISLIIYNAVSNIVARLEVIRLCRPQRFPVTFFHAPQGCHKVTVGRKLVIEAN